MDRLEELRKSKSKRLQLEIVEALFHETQNLDAADLVKRGILRALVDLMAVNDDNIKLSAIRSLETLCQSWSAKMLSYNVFLKTGVPECILRLDEFRRVAYFQPCFQILRLLLPAFRDHTLPDGGYVYIINARKAFRLHKMNEEVFFAFLDAICLLPVHRPPLIAQSDGLPMIFELISLSKSSHSMAVVRELVRDLNGTVAVIRASGLQMLADISVLPGPPAIIADILHDIFVTHGENWVKMSDLPDFFPPLVRMCTSPSSSVQREVSQSILNWVRGKETAIVLMGDLQRFPFLLRALATAATSSGDKITRINVAKCLNRCAIYCKESHMDQAKILVLWKRSSALKSLFSLLLSRTMEIRWQAASCLDSLSYWRQPLLSDGVFGYTGKDEEFVSGRVLAIFRDICDANKSWRTVLLANFSLIEYCTDFLHPEKFFPSETAYLHSKVQDEKYQRELQEYRRDEMKKLQALPIQSMVYSRPVSTSQQMNSSRVLESSKKTLRSLAPLVIQSKLVRPAESIATPTPALEIAQSGASPATASPVAPPGVITSPPVKSSPATKGLSSRKSQPAPMRKMASSREISSAAGQSPRSPRSPGSMKSPKRAMTTAALLDSLESELGEKPVSKSPRKAAALLPVHSITDLYLVIVKHGLDEHGRVSKIADVIFCEAVKIATFGTCGKVLEALSLLLRNREYISRFLLTAAALAHIPHARHLSEKEITLATSVTVKMSQIGLLRPRMCSDAHLNCALMLLNFLESGRPGAPDIDLCRYLNELVNTEVCSQRFIPLGGLDVIAKRFEKLVEEKNQNGNMDYTAAVLCIFVALSKWRDNLPLLYDINLVALIGGFVESLMEVTEQMKKEAQNILGYCGVILVSLSNCDSRLAKFSEQNGWNVLGQLQNKLSLSDQRLFAQGVARFLATPHGKSVPHDKCTALLIMQGMLSSDDTMIKSTVLWALSLCLQDEYLFISFRDGKGPEAVLRILHHERDSSVQVGLVMALDTIWWQSDIEFTARAFAEYGDGVLLLISKALPGSMDEAVMNTSMKLLENLALRVTSATTFSEEVVRGVFCSISASIGKPTSNKDAENRRFTAARILQHLTSCGNLWIDMILRGGFGDITSAVTKCDAFRKETSKCLRQVHTLLQARQDECQRLGISLMPPPAAKKMEDMDWF